jgi:septum formation protein
MTRGAPRLILASASPRRHHLLSQAGFEFEVVEPGISESFSGGLTAREITCWNAVRKGSTVARAHPDAVVLAADTLVALEGEIIGKPSNRAAAVRILQRLSGRTHIVASGVFIGHLHSGRSASFSEVSRVVFKKLNERMIEDYLAKIDPLDKAGAYAAQGHGREIIARIVGSRSNVIGLPLEKTRAALARFAIRPRVEISRLD